MTDLTSLLGSWSPQEPIRSSPEDQLRTAIIQAGMDTPDEIHLDGKLHRFRSGTKGTPHKGDKTGWYVCYGDATPAGRFGDWRSGVEQTFRADVGRVFTASEEMAHTKRMVEARTIRDKELAVKHETASDTVELIWDGCMAASAEHPYLKRKGIKPNGARVTGDGRLVVPLYSEDGTLSSLQYIDSDGGKLYHPGGATSGKFWMVGNLDEPGMLYSAEGFATSATIYEATGRPCVVGYSASNLVPTVAALRSIYGKDQAITIVSDNDASGVGQKYADQASAKYGARVVMPPILGDANDYSQSGHDLAALLVPTTGAAVIEKLKVVFGDDLSETYEAPDELIQGLMVIGSLTVIYGDSNSGKTFFALALATAVATGLPCFSRQTDPGLVIYLASEAPASIKARMQALKKYHNLDLSNLAMVPVPMNFYDGDGDASDVIELVRAISVARGKPVRLIIADTLARMSAGANENSGEDMGPVMARFDRVAQESRAALAIIHHNGKDAAKGARGWSGIRAHIDTEIEVEEQDGMRKAQVTKQRELPSKGDAIYFKLHIMEMGVGKFGDAATTCVAIPDDDVRSVDAPAKKIPQKLAEAIKNLERAWWHGACEVRQDVPYVSWSAMVDMLHLTDSQAARERQLVGGGIVATLVTSGHCDWYEHGLIVLDSGHSSVLMMQRKR